MRPVATALASGFILIAISVTPAFADSFFVGDRVSVTAGPLNVRMSASIYDAPYGTQKEGNRGVIFQGPVEKDGYTWWFIDYDSGVDGWSVQNYLGTAHVQSTQTAAAVTQIQALYWQLKNILTVLQELKAQQ